MSGSLRSRNVRRLMSYAGATRFNFGGYIKADTMVSRYSGGSVTGLRA